MRGSSLSLSISLLAGLASATSYNLVNDYSGSSFYNQFDFFTETDPTEGFTNYVSYNDAVNYGLIWNESVPTWGVDSYTTLGTSGPGRTSIRMTSKDTYTHGLFIIDIAHMPESVCGVWPSFWTFGQTGSWPQSGEIDIVEYTNLASQNKVSGHTESGCTISGSSQSGSLQGTDCSTSGDDNGCSFLDTSNSTAGTGFNDNGGGVYAMEWTSEYINVWFFPRGYIPSSIENNDPDVSEFGTPVANFCGCDIDQYFYNHAIIFDTTFCGTWAGAAFSEGGCPATSCVEYVANNPMAFKDAFWSINYLKIYQDSSSSKAKRDFIRRHARETHRHRF